MQPFRCFAVFESARCNPTLQLTYQLLFQCQSVIDFFFRILFQALSFLGWKPKVREQVCTGRRYVPNFGIDSFTYTLAHLNYSVNALIAR